MAKTLTRFNMRSECSVEPMNAEMVVYSDGEYVLFEAYDALVSENGKLKAKVAALERELQLKCHPLQCLHKRG